MFKQNNFSKNRNILISPMKWNSFFKTTFTSREQLGRLLSFWFQFFQFFVQFIRFRRSCHFIIFLISVVPHCIWALNEPSDLTNFQDHHNTEFSRQAREGGRGSCDFDAGGIRQWACNRLRHRLWRQPLHPRWPRGHAALRSRSWSQKYRNAK